jgi:hypothetical protein
VETLEDLLDEAASAHWLQNLTLETKASPQDAEALDASLSLDLQTALLVNHDLRLVVEAFEWEFQMQIEKEGAPPVEEAWQLDHRQPEPLAEGKGTFWLHRIS